MPRSLSQATWLTCVGQITHKAVTEEASKLPRDTIQSGTAFAELINGQLHIVQCERDVKQEASRGTFTTSKDMKTKGS